jgi:cell division initiation protein
VLRFSADDIANQDFERSFRGYSPQQVREFLETVAREWEHLVTELERMRKENDRQEDSLAEYREREQSLHEALNMAKRMADDIKEEAEREAERTVAEAELEAERIVAGAEERVDSLRDDIYALKQQRNRYRAQLRGLLESHLQLVRDMEEGNGFDGDLEVDELPEPPAAPRDPSASDRGASSAGGTDPQTETSDTDADPVGDEDIESSQPADRRPGTDHPTAH